jgi:hypothetical protein
MSYLNVHQASKYKIHRSHATQNVYSATYWFVKIIMATVLANKWHVKHLWCDLPAAPDYLLARCLEPDMTKTPPSGISWASDNTGGRGKFGSVKKPHTGPWTIRKTFRVLRVTDVWFKTAVQSNTYSLLGSDVVHFDLEVQTFQRYLIPPSR